MAVSQIHSRSISLPSRLHPINEAELHKLQQWQISSLSETPPITSEAIQSSLLTLAELYNSLQELNQCQANQQSHFRQDEKSIQDSLESSIGLIDSCNIIREMIQMVKENVQALQSALRRKGLDSSIQNDVYSYISFRKKMNKCIAKRLKTLQNLENNKGSDLSVGEESPIRVFMEVSRITIATFKSTSVFLSSPTTIKSGRWSLVSKLMLMKPVASEKDPSVVSEMGCVDLALNDLQRGCTSSGLKGADRQIVQSSLQNLESCVEGIEIGLERLYRKLLQSRVTLLNIVANH